MTKRILVVEDQPCHHSLESRHRPRRAELSISLICSLAMFTAIRRASSRVSGFAAHGDRLAGRRGRALRTTSLVPRQSKAAGSGITDT